MYVCIFGIMYVCMYVSMYLCIFVSMYPCIYVSMSLSIYASTYLCIYVFPHILCVGFLFFLDISAPPPSFSSSLRLHLRTSASLRSSSSCTHRSSPQSHLNVSPLPRSSQVSFVFGRHLSSPMLYGCAVAGRKVRRLGFPAYFAYIEL